MKPDIWMPLYIADYMADTNRLTTLQHGAYLLLLMDYWRNGMLPNDDLILAQIAKMSPDAWSIARAVLEHFFSITSEGWRHQRVDEELAKAGINKEKAHTRAVSAAKARWGKENQNQSNAPSNAPSNATSNAQGLLVQCPSPSPSNKDKNPSCTESKKPAFDDEDMRFAEWFLAELRTVDPGHKTPNLKAWAKDARLMRVTDERNPRESASIMKWVVKDSFWQSNIQSVGKLREKWDQLNMKKGGAVKERGFEC